MIGGEFEMLVSGGLFGTSWWFHHYYSSDFVVVLP